MEQLINNENEDENEEISEQDQLSNVFSSIIKTLLESNSITMNYALGNIDPESTITDRSKHILSTKHVPEVPILNLNEETEEYDEQFTDITAWITASQLDHDFHGYVVDRLNSLYTLEGYDLSAKYRYKIDSLSINPDVWYNVPVFNNKDLDNIFGTPTHHILRGLSERNHIPYVPPELTSIINKMIFQITQLVVRQESGYNSDDRSHQDVPILTPGLDGDIIDHYLFFPIYNIINPTGITWGDVMTGVMWTKGSKWDLWYELFSNVDHRIKFHNGHWTLFLDTYYDHGS